ncbi:hypothetical protein C3L33_11830, partial [Rhododendron williamsianum]
KMSEESKVHHHHHQQQQPEPPPPQYGTFQGVQNYPPQPVIGFPQPVAPPGSAEPPPQYYAQVLLQVMLSLKEDLFIIGFFLAAIPWYVGAIILLCVRSVDYREKPGYIACTVAVSSSYLSFLFNFQSLHTLSHFPSN